MRGRKGVDSLLKEGKGGGVYRRIWRFLSPRAFLKQMVCSEDFQLFCVQLHEIPLPVQFILINNPKHFFRAERAREPLP